MRETRTRNLALALAVVSSLGAAPSRAQEAMAERWELSLTSYVWGTALKGDVGVGRVDTNVDASFDDILDNLNGALMLSAEARKGRLGLLSDTVFADLGDDGETTDGRLKIDAKAKMWIQSLGGAYSIGTWKLADFESAGPLSVSVDPYAGARYTYLNAEVRGRLDLPDLGISARRTAETSESWVDPFIGLRTSWVLGDRWSLLLGGDVGGISTSDQYSAEAYGLAGYRFGLFGATTADLRLGYRVLKQKYEDGDGPSAFEWDMTIHGPVVGLKIGF
jgi:hypothetical protein